MYNFNMSPRLEWMLIGAALLLLLFLAWMYEKYHLPPLLRNQRIAAQLKKGQVGKVSYRELFDGRME